MSTAFVNGEFIALDAARISAMDAGLQHGVGLFETFLGGMPAEPKPGEHELTGAWALMLEEHLQRLTTSARELGLSAGLNVEALHEAALRTIAQAKLPRARVRITITGGDLNLLAAAREKSSPSPTKQGTVLITAVPATVYPERMVQEGVAVAIADARANPFNPTEGHKTLNYWWRLRELGLAAQKDAAEALVFSITNHVVGGCVSAIIVIKDGVARSPIARGEERLVASMASSMAEGETTKATGAIMPSAVLPGITRQWALDELTGEGVEVKKQMVTISDVLEADEVLLLNSSWGVLPVVRVEGREIADGKVGETGALLATRWKRELTMLAGG